MVSCHVSVLLGICFDPGRSDLLELGLNGSAARVTIDSVYYGWTAQGGRLQQLKAGTPGTNSLFDNTCPTQPSRRLVT